MPRLNSPICMTLFFLWLIQSRLANQRSITKLLHGGSLIGSNLHNGGALRRRGLDCVPFLSAEPIRSLYGFETCARLWFYLFHYSFIGLLRPRTTKLSFCDNHSGGEGAGREHFHSLSTTLTARIQFVFWNEKSVSSAGVDLWKWHSYTKRRHTWAESHVYADTYILRRQLATPLLDVYLNEIASNDKMTAIDKNRILLLHFSYFICGPYIGYLTLHWLYKYWFCYLLPLLHLLSIYIVFIHTLQKKLEWKVQGIRFSKINCKNKKFVPCWNSSGGPWVVGLRQNASGQTSDPAQCPAGRWTRKIASSEKSARAENVSASQRGHSVGLAKRTSADVSAASKAQVSPFSEGISALKACQGTRRLERESKLANSPAKI